MSVIRIKAGENLQTALDAVKPGDTIILPRGYIFREQIVMRKPGWITIQVEGWEAGIGLRRSKGRV